MCGIIGSLAKNASGFTQKDIDIYTQMLYADAIRGWDATGVFGVDKVGNIQVKKSARAAGPFMATTNYKAFTTEAFQKFYAMVGHNRKATHGEKRHEDAHPFWDKQDKIVLVHNGMISNHKEFCKDSTVDSAAITNALAEGDIDDVISRVQGAFAFVWYNTEERKVYFIRNDLRPLNFVETSTAYHFASEMDLAGWVVKRNDQNILKLIPLEPWKLYSYENDTRTFKEERTIVQKKVIYPVVTTTIITTGAWKATNGSNKLFLTEDDLKTKEDIKKNIEHGDTIQVWINGYENVSDRASKLFCTVVNADVINMEILLYVSKPIFDAMDLCQVHEVTVTSVIVDNNDKSTVFVKDPRGIVHYETLNNIIVTEQMWRHPDFPAICDCCGELVDKQDLAKSEVYIIKQDQFLLVCPHCTNPKD